MKKLSTISLFIFGVVVTAILVAGLVFYQNQKDNNLPINNTTQIGLNSKQQLSSNTKSNSNTNSTSTTNTKVLDMKELAKHNTENDCWLLISGKVYNITSYFGKHPGGNGNMLATCGTDATDAYMTKDPNATTSGSRPAHSGRAQSLLQNYYIGDLK